MKSESSSSGYDTKQADDDLESWLNNDDDSLIGKSSSKPKTKKTEDDWDNWGDNTNEKVKKSSKGKSSDGWEDVDWNTGFSSSDKQKQKQPLVGNLLDLGEDSEVTTNGNSGWDNEVWANEDEDDDWQSLDTASDNRKLK